MQRFRETSHRSCRVPSSLLAIAVLLPAGCVLDTGVGDPATSKVNDKLTGYWQSKEQLLTVVPLDASTCLVDWMTWEGTDSAPKPSLRVLNKGWLTDIDRVTYLTLEMFIPNRKQSERFAVFKLEIAGDTVTAIPLNYDFPAFSNAATPKELEDALRKHHGNAKAFQDPAVFRRTNADTTVTIRKAFYSE